MIEHVDLCRLVTADPFRSLFPVRAKTLDSVAQSMRESGYDDAEPIVAWRGVVIDGHTRLRAAQAALLSSVAVVEREFAGEDEALEYAIRRQRDRRNLTDADLLRCLDALDRRKDKSSNLKRGPEASSQASGDSGKSAEATAEILGTSRDKVEKARRVLDAATEETKAAILAGEKSVNAAVSEMRQAKHPDTPAKPPKAPACECEALRARVTELEEQLAELNQILDEMRLDNEAMSRTLDAEDLLAQFNAEIKRAHALSAATQTRNAGLMNSLAAANKDAVRWMRKAERLGKRLSALETSDAGSLTSTEEDDFIDMTNPPPDAGHDWFCEAEA